jgi:hypothetical protein
MGAGVTFWNLVNDAASPAFETFESYNPSTGTPWPSLRHPLTAP